MCITAVMTGSVTDRYKQSCSQIGKETDRQTVELFQVGRYGTFMQSIMWQSE